MTGWFNCKELSVTLQTLKRIWPGANPIKSLLVFYDPILQNFVTG